MLRSVVVNSEVLSARLTPEQREGSKTVMFGSVQFHELNVLKVQISGPVCFF